MNRLANLALSIGETLFHEAGRLLFGIALGAAKQAPGHAPAGSEPGTWPSLVPSRRRQSTALCWQVRGPGRNTPSSR